LRALGNVTVFKTTTADKVAGRIKYADIVITNKVILGKKESEAATSLKLICVAATGVIILI